MRYFEIGKIVNTQGVHGDLRVMPTTSDITRFELLSQVLLRQKNETRTYGLERVWYHKQFVILKLQGVDDMTAAECLKNSVLLVTEENALPLGEDEYYIGDLYGMDVITDEGESLGKLTDIRDTGANDVYTVRSAEGVEILIPAIKQCILNVSVAEKKMTVKLLNGLR